MKTLSALLLCFATLPLFAESSFEGSYAGGVNMTYRAPGNGNVNLNAACERAYIDVRQDKDWLHVTPRQFLCGDKFTSGEALDVRIEGTKLFDRNGNPAGAVMNGGFLIYEPGVSPLLTGTRYGSLLLPAQVEGGTVRSIVWFEIAVDERGVREVVTGVLPRR